jgi:rhodanese-related sulfurtransferase
MMAVLALAATALSAVAGFINVPRFDADTSAFQVLEQRITADHPRVPHLTPAEVAIRSRDASSIVVLDVREPAEFEVSRVPGAIRIDPAISIPAFIASHGRLLAGKTLILYCSVGVRSTRLAERLLPVIGQNGAVGVYNMSGGIFRWHNEGRTLVDSQGATDAVHPYDRFWGSYVERTRSTRYTPIDR